MWFTIRKPTQLASTNQRKRGLSIRSLSPTANDLDFERRLIFIRRSAWYGRIQTLKSNASQGFLPMPGPLAEMLLDHLKTWKPNPEILLFANKLGRPYSANKLVQKRLWPILDALGIPRCDSMRFDIRIRACWWKAVPRSRLLKRNCGTPTHVPRSGFTVTLLGIHSATRSSWRCSGVSGRSLSAVEKGNGPVLSFRTWF